MDGYGMAVNRTVDITGQRFGSLTALQISHVANRMAYWKYQCDCGKVHVARANTVKHSWLKKNDPELPSCGCVELARKTKHGFRKAKNTHPAYRAYRGMLSRCFNKSSPNYKWYGEVGVTVCDEWVGNPEAFIHWALANGWAEGLHLDKDILCKELGIFPHIYSPITCQWVTPKINVGFATNRDNFGKHPNIKLSHCDVAQLLDAYHTGEQRVQKELARTYGVTPSTIKRLIDIAKGAA